MGVPGAHGHLSRPSLRTPRTCSNMETQDCAAGVAHNLERIAVSHRRYHRRLPAGVTAVLVPRAKAAIEMPLSHGGAAGPIGHSWPS